MSERRWTDDDWFAVRDAIAREAFTSASGAATLALDALGPAVERIRREAKAEALREAADAAQPLGYATTSTDAVRTWLRTRAIWIGAGDA